MNYSDMNLLVQEKNSDLTMEEKGILLTSTDVFYLQGKVNSIKLRFLYLFLNEVIVHL